MNSSTVIDVQALQWACSHKGDANCRCHIEVPFREYVGDAIADVHGPWYAANAQDAPALYVAWNVRCPVHGFSPDSKEYKMSNQEAEGSVDWYGRWRELMQVA